MTKREVKILKETPAGEHHQVVTFLRVGGGGDKHCHRKKPCKDCPWRKDSAGVFPAEAFKVSAKTAYDMSDSTFACHSSGIDKPATCAGFLLNGAHHNLSIRLAYMRGKLTNDFHDNGHELFQNYREMAVANGVDADDPVLAPCRD